MRLCGNFLCGLHSFPYDLRIESNISNIGLFSLYFLHIKSNNEIILNFMFLTSSSDFILHSMSVSVVGVGTLCPFFHYITKYILFYIHRCLKKNCLIITYYCFVELYEQFIYDSKRRHVRNQIRYKIQNYINSLFNNPYCFCDFFD